MNEELTVLVADDEPELLQAVCQLIDWQALGFRLVGRASNGLDALQLVEELQPDFLLTARTGQHRRASAKQADRRQPQNDPKRRHHARCFPHLPNQRNVSGQMQPANSTSTK